MDLSPEDRDWVNYARLEARDAFRAGLVCGFLVGAAACWLLLLFLHDWSIWRRLLSGH